MATFALHSHLGMIEMAKPKAKTGRGRPAVEEESFNVPGHRVNGTYLERTTRAASANRSSASGLIDQAVAKYDREGDRRHGSSARSDGLIHGDLTMSATTLPIAPSAPRPGVDTADGDQRIAIRGVSWDFYDRLSEAIGEDRHIFLTYDGKDLEIMVPGTEHENYKELVSDFLAIVPAACGIRSRKLGQTTWKRYKIKRGLEADQCVFYDPEKLSIVIEALATKTKDLSKFPNPDLAVEIDVSRPKVDRQGVYAKLKIPEVWRFNGDVVVIEQLGPNGKYVVAERSRWMPVRALDVRRWVVDEDASDDVVWKRRLTKWAKGLAAGGGGGP